MKNKTKSKTIGYILVHSSGVYSSGKVGDGEGVLWFDDHATLFSSRLEIKKAIKKSRIYADKLFTHTDNHAWPWLEESHILPVKSA